MAPADVQVDPVIAFDGIIHHDLFSHRDIDGNNDLLVTEFWSRVIGNPPGSWRTLSDWLTGKLICAGMVEGGVGAAAQAAPQDADMVAGIFAPSES